MSSKAADLPTDASRARLKPPATQINPAQTPKPRPPKQGFESIIKALKSRVSSKDKIAVISGLELLLGAGVSVSEALQSLKLTSRKGRLKNAIETAIVLVDEGRPLWKVLAESGLADRQTITLVHLGEQSGTLQKNLKIAVTQAEKTARLKSKLRAALMYPAFVLVVTVVVGLGVAWFLLPQLADTLSQLRVDLPFLTVLFIGVGTFLKSYGIFVVPLALTLFAALAYVIFVAPKTRKIGERILYLVPGVGKLMREIEVARFGYLLGALLQAGLPVTKAMALLKESSTSHQYLKLYTHLTGRFDDGYNFQTSLANYPAAERLLPAEVRQIITASEKSGTLSSSLTHIGETFEQRSEISVKNVEVILEPILLVVIWFGVVSVAVAVILPIYSLTSGL